MIAKLISCLLLVGVSAPLFAKPNEARIPVSIRLTGDDGLTQKLSVALQDALQRDFRLRAADRTDQNPILVVSDTNVGWDKLGGKTVIVFDVEVSHGSDETFHKVGVCYESAIGKCVDTIFALVRAVASDLPETGSDSTS